MKAEEIEKDLRIILRKLNITEPETKMIVADIMFFVIKKINRELEREQMRTKNAENFIKRQALKEGE